MSLKVFGKSPSGKISDRIVNSPNFRNGKFQNISETRMMAEGVSYAGLILGFFNKPRSSRPSQPLPSIKTDLRSYHSQKPAIFWFGHSSYLIHVNGYNILVDPVFSGNASPFSYSVKSFAGTDVYGVNDMPPIDLLIITHDHYDHLDYKTVSALRPKVKRVCTSLGVGSHLIHWGYDESVITQFDWWEQQVIDHNVELAAAPARHFSGRLFTRGKTLWSSFILDIQGYRIFIGGDSGYDTHFRTIGERFGPFDIALLECGQYNTAWPLIHMMPEEVVQASLDLKAKVLMPVHWGKFALAYHPWNEPVKRLMLQAQKDEIKVTTPMIGEPVIIDEIYPDNKWWQA